jgi:hypothetical protein
MKWIFAALLLPVAMAYADTTPRMDVDENHDPREEQQYSDKYDQDEGDTKVIQEKQESEVNDDFDPEVDAIDNDMTPDEGTRDD